MNRLKCILVTVFAFFLASFGIRAEELQPAVIVKKNGSKIECFLDFNSMVEYSYIFNEVDYKTSPKSTYARIKKDQIHQIIFSNVDDQGGMVIVENVEYVSAKDYAKGDFSKRKSLLVCVRQIGHITLYQWSSKVQELVKTYYICRKKKEEVGVLANVLNFVGSPYSDKVKIRVSGSRLDDCYSKLFKDCPDVVNAIQAGRLTAKDFEQIVTEYNTYMAEKGK